MEENTSNQSTVDNQIQSHVPTKSPNSFLLGVGGLILLGIGLLGGYFIANSQKKSEVQNTNQITQVSPTSIQQIPTTEPTSVVPSNWTVKTSTTCNSTLPLPPKKAPYFIPEDPNTPPAVNDEGSFWVYEEIKDTQSQNPLFTDSVWAIFKDPERAGSGYVGGLVNIECAVNNNKYTTQTLLDKYSKNFTDGTYSGISISSKEFTTMWNRQVAAVLIKGGMSDATEPEYLFATTSHIYRISKKSMSSNSFVQETTETIFNNLTFKD